ncbi:class IIb bacteriocin, lactobin A/cerein 7B family [Leuconostoc suionicum]|uniref:class IIb bacteriocin, lactobin A/cerein 7B family n=2 Tax=Leuconostoc suionicum TaxID=1511761 RepID=UPI0021A9DB0A|nr:class IIb bacteriocin, lactobin A/cerein 7B family [Leuconostoc suionicum]MDC2817225.1 class IIb bacteriocin, lactobin A/cerein 7B family [Leuconostoc suionicum]
MPILLRNFKELNSEELLDSGGIAPLIVAGLWIAGVVGGVFVWGYDKGYQIGKDIIMTDDTNAAIALGVFILYFVIAALRFFTDVGILNIISARDLEQASHFLLIITFVNLIVWPLKKDSKFSFLR